MKTKTEHKTEQPAMDVLVEKTIQLDGLVRRAVEEAKEKFPDDIFQVDLMLDEYLIVHVKVVRANREFTKEGVA